jgi:hypothetical protein
MTGRRIARPGRSAGAARREPVPPTDPRGREANSIDRYSLALQLIQVFPIVTGGTALLVTTTWVARALAGFSLLVGTVWAVRLERAALRRRRGHGPDIPAQAAVTAPPDAAAGATAAALPASSVVHGPDGVLLTRVTSEYGEINISIKLQPAAADSVYRRRARRRRLMKRRHERPGAPRRTESPGE